MAINFPAEPEINDFYTVGESTWKWDGISWNLSATATENFTFKNFSADSGNTTANSPDDTLSIVGGSNIDTELTGDTVTISFTGTGPDLQNLFSTITGDSGDPINADGATNSLAFSGQNGIEISTNAATKTVVMSYTGSTIPFTNLSDITTAGLSVDKIYEPAITMFRVDNTGTSAYTFAPHYSTGNPTVYVIAGTTVAFDLNAIPGLPFEVQDPLGDPYNEGLTHVATDGTVSTGANAQGKSSGTLYWRIPENISGGYRYQCQTQVAMVGGLTVKRLSVL